MTLAEAFDNIGRRVLYHPGHSGATVERGVITSTNSRWAFVRYDGDTGSKATPASLLTLEVA